MSSKTIKDIAVIGSGKMPESLRRDVSAPKEIAEHPTAARIQELLVLNPGVAEFRVGDLNKMSDDSLDKLLQDIEKALEIRTDGS